MNDILQLRGAFQTKSASRPGPPELPAGQQVTSEKIGLLINSLENVCHIWEKADVPFSPLVEVRYIRVVAKSNRCHRILFAAKQGAGTEPVGARFDNDAAGSPYHVITYRVKMATIRATLDELTEVRSLLDSEFAGCITAEALALVNRHGLPTQTDEIPKSAFAQIIRDAHFVDSFDVQEQVKTAEDLQIVTLFDVDKPLAELLHNANIIPEAGSMLNENTVCLNRANYSRLAERYPCLISMSCPDLNELAREDFGETTVNNAVRTIDSPSDEPTIGVIDTLFYDDVYFSEWVTADNNCVDKEILSPGLDDYEHGTRVSSIIVDGPTLNPDLDDGCGRFRVRHFGVASAGRFHVATVMNSIKNIIDQNRDIKVWNLSLGSESESPDNFVSPMAYQLDLLQSKYEDIIFVVAGTNKSKNQATGTRVGSPADSINSVVVNSVDKDGMPAKYSRSGPVLQFYKKPDISYYGGVDGAKINTCGPIAEKGKTGTSYAAPWIARKLAYLIQVLGFSREESKALLIHSATSWDGSGQDDIRGYGVVPIRIEDIVGSADDEIRFNLSGSIDAVEAYNFSIPVPTKNEKFPYIAKATLCYFPECERTQGVDYTSTELDLHFGRIHGGTIDSINKNIQGEKNAPVFENDARLFWRKWDNVKHIQDVWAPRKRPRRTYENALWGIKIRKAERRDTPADVHKVRFGLVVTLKAIDGKNRIEEFVQQCSLRGWLVNRIDIKQQVDLYNVAEAELHFDE